MQRILVVEDEPTIATGLQDDLELEGYAVEVVADGDLAMRRVLAERFDLIVLDIMLPGTDGFTICREARMQGIRTPIVVLTAKGQETDKVVGLELGADDYITKPFSPRELLARVRAVLRRAHNPATSFRVHCIGDLTVDLDRCEVSRQGRALDLTATEFKLLRTFIEHRGEVLSIDRILEDVWGKDVYLTDRVVYTHVNNLRGKIERDPHCPQLLISVRGMGYRFEG